MLPASLSAYRRALLRLALALALFAGLAGPAQMQAPPPAPRAVCGTPQLLAEGAALARTVALRPLSPAELRAQGKLDGAGQLLADTVGQQHQFWVRDLSSIGDCPTFNQITATCKKVGAHAYIYLQNGYAVSDSALTTISSQFDNNIYGKDRDAFGEEPNPGIDGDPRIYVLLCAIEGAGGFFDPVNEYRNIDLAGTCYAGFSNQREMFYVNLSDATPGSPDSLATVAHEFQHLIHFRYDGLEETWVNEGCSGLAETICGYPLPWYILATGVPSDPGFLEEPDHQLTLTYPEWGSAGDHLRASYGAAYMWSLYLWEHYGGNAVTRRLVADPAQGIEGVNDALAAVGASDRFEQAFRNWTVANFIDEGTGPYGYATIQLLPSGYDNRTTFQRPLLTATHSAYPASGIRSINYWAGNAVKLTGGSGQTLNLSFNGANDNRFAVSVVRSSTANLAPGTNDVSSIALDDSWDGSTSVAGMGTSVQAVLLIPASLSERGSKTYSYSATLGAAATATPTPIGGPSPTPPSGCADPYEPNDTLATAIEAESGPVYTSYICAADDEDYFKIWAHGGDRLQVDLYDLPHDYDLDLYGPDESLLTFSVNLGTDPERIILDPAPATGYYYAHITAWEGGDTVHPYHLRFTLTSTAPSPTPTYTPPPASPTPTLTATYTPPPASPTPTYTPRPPSPTPTSCAYPPCATPTPGAPGRSIYLPLLLRPEGRQLSRGFRA